ncbi:hypothetical protein BDN71DRAFT_1453503 [Pleurotus eryngii]|uniref:WDR59/RTC1-like RING zinc finger domain-containing protein n=1 Tax=Pleurotus eryngii TaxID=5323 RepID=A0A9P5ZQY0_PLEER|nr:hypothetical protein BDN71DRAFT_1453503 [Pleurotus eryngii]
MPATSHPQRSPRSSHIHREPTFTLSPAIPLPTSPPITSLLSARRPSFTAALPTTGIQRDDAEIERKLNVPVPSGIATSMPSAPSSPEDGGNFRRSLQIDMKGLVGDAVGNMSISPASRDVVLAARRGLFIIDLEAPLEIPRFLPQGGTWDVADVQWNPHPSRAEYIVSTSSEKLLIWNLRIVGKTSIEHILHSHYRAITDINWHTTECDTVASTGIDSWIWTWDLREPRKPIFGLSAFNESGTQVKWNRQDPNILASSHANEVLIWDRRKGSLPMVSIRAHDSKIYGIDWSHSIRNEIVTCSLDHTIKVWDVNASPAITSSFRDLHSPSLGSSLQSFTLYPSDVEVGVISSTASSNGINGTGNSRQTPMAPKTTIRTVYPVWRARNLPFAQGVLSLAQRGETALEMYRTDSSFPGAGSKEKTPTNIHTTSHVPVEVFEGHKDVVKEFVWRKGGQEATEYQLITWSKDRTLRFWPMDQETMQKVGHIYSPPRGRARYPTVNDQNISFRNPPEGAEYHPALSAPIGHRSILAEVRAAPPRMRRGDLGHYNIHTSTQSINPVLQPHVGSAHRASLHEHFAAAKGSNGNTALLSTPDVGDYVSASTNGNLETTGSGSGPIGMPPGTIRRSGTMSKGGLGGRSVARMDALSWLQNVRVGPGSQQHRSSSSGPGSSSTRSSTGQESNPPSRLGSRSRPGSGSDPRNTLSRQTSDTYDDNEHGGFIEEKSKDLDKDKGRSRRSSSLSRTGADDKKEESSQSLQDEITSVLNRLSSSKIKLEKHDLTKKRTCTLGLHGPWGEPSSVFIRVTFTFPKDYPSALHPEGTPTIEVERNPLISNRTRALILRRLKVIRERRRPCLEPCLRYLTFGTEEQNIHPPPMDSESSDDDEHMTRKSRDFTVALLRNNKNLAEPRTSQGTFGPNGELVCFFRAPPRIFRSVNHDLSTSPSKPTAQETADANGLHLYQSPSLLVDAIRHLGMAASDPSTRSLGVKRIEGAGGGDILRIMTNLLTVSHNNKHFFDLKPQGDIPKNYHPQAPARRSTIYIARTNDIAGPDRKVATGYVFSGDSLASVCDRNAQVAKEYGRYDHQRIFQMLRSVLSTLSRTSSPSVNHKVLMQLYAELAKEKDIQMLAMLAVLLLQAGECAETDNDKGKQKSKGLARSPLSPLVTSLTSFDYFSLAQSINSGNSPALLPWPRVASPSVQTTPTQTRSSWSSIFNAGTMRQLMSGSHDTLKENSPPQPGTPTVSSSEGGIPVPSLNRPPRTPDPPRRITRHDSIVRSPSAISKSWNESLSATKPGAGTPSPPYPSSKVHPNRSSGEKRLIFTPEPNPNMPTVNPLQEPRFVGQLLTHIHVYAELLFAWQLYHRRLELLKCIRSSIHDKARQDFNSGIFHSFSRCGHEILQNGNSCPSCGQPSKMPLCSICRMPIKGLSKSCLNCLHVSHIRCWQTYNQASCSTGCGCHCFDTGPAHQTLQQNQS